MTDSEVPSPASPVARTRDASPPHAPMLHTHGLNCNGQVVVDTLEVRLLSGRVFANVKRNCIDKSDEIWYTYNFRCHIASLMSIETCRLILLNAKGDVISDDDCVFEDSYVTAVVRQPKEA